MVRAGIICKEVLSVMGWIVGKILKDMEQNGMERSVKRFE